MAAILEPSRLSPIAVPAAGRAAPLRSPGSPARATGSEPSLTAAAGLTSRGAVTVALVVLVVLVAIATASVTHGRSAVAGPTSSPVAAAGAPVGPVVAIVEPGDTLWSIAREIQPRGDIRPLVDRLVAANGSAVIVPGQELRLPPS